MSLTIAKVIATIWLISLGLVHLKVLQLYAKHKWLLYTDKWRRMQVQRLIRWPAVMLMMTQAAVIAAGSPTFIWVPVIVTTLGSLAIFIVYRKRTEK